MIRYKGASYSPGDLNPGKNGIKCHVMLLDGKRDTVEMNKKALAGVLFDYICRRLDILEREYFGLQFEDDKKLTRWLDLSKPLKKQLKKKENRLHFRVKFYAIDPSVLQDNTRYQFFLQLKNDIAYERLICLPNITASVLAYIIQAEIGDYDRAVHHYGYVSEFKLLPALPKMMEEDISKAHIALIGTAPEDAEIQFLQKVKWLDRYGVHLFEVHDGEIPLSIDPVLAVSKRMGEERVRYYLGMGPPGLSVFRDTTRVSYYVWSKIVKVSYRRKRFIVFVRGGARELTDSQVASFAFEVGSSKAAKYIWKCCVDNIAFYTSDEKVDHSVPKSRSARFVRTSSGRYVRKNSKDHIGMTSQRGGLEDDSDLHMLPGSNVLQHSNPPLPPRQTVGKQAKKKGSKGNDGDNFDEEPLFPKYENIFHFAPKEKKATPLIATVNNNPPEEKPPLESSNAVLATSMATTILVSYDDVHRLSSVVELAEEELSGEDEDEDEDDDENDDKNKHKRDYDTDDELSQSSSDSDEGEEIINPKPHYLQGNQPHPFANQHQNTSHVIHCDEDIDHDLNAIEDEQKMESSDLAWNSNSMYDRLEPLDEVKPTAAEEQAAAPQINSSAVLSQIKSRSTSVASSGLRTKSPEGTKPPSLHEVLSSPPPPPPPPKIPTGQFVAPPYSPRAAATTDPAQQKRHGSIGEKPGSATVEGLNERAIDCGNDQVIRRVHPKEPPKPEAVATRTVLMAWMLEQQSKDSKMSSTPSASQPSTLPNFHKISAPNFTRASSNAQPPVPQNKPPVPQNKPPPINNKPTHLTAPAELKPPQKVPPPKAPKPVSKPPVMPPPQAVNHSDASEKPSPAHKPPAKPDASNELSQTDSSSSLDAGGQFTRGKSRLPPGLDIAVLTRINPEFDYNAQDFAHKDSIDRRKKDQEANRPPVSMFSPDASDITKEFVPPGGSNTELNQQTSMEEEKDRIMAYIKNRKVENKISGDSTDAFMCAVPAEVEAKHQKKHQEKQLRKSLRNKLKRVMPNGREKRDKDSEMPNTNWQWGKELAPPISSAKVTSPSRLPPTSREAVVNSMSSFLSSNEDGKSSNIPPVTTPRIDTRNIVTDSSVSSGEIRGSGVGMEVEQSSSVLPSQQHKDTSSSITTITTTTAAVDRPPVSTPQQSKWPTPSSNRLIPPQTAPKPTPPIAPKPPIQQKPILKPHPFAAKKPSPPIPPKPSIAPKPQLQQKRLHESESSPTDQLRVKEDQKSVDQPCPPVPLQLQALAGRGEDTVSSSGSSRPSYSPQPPSEMSAPPPYSSPCGVPDRMISPDNAINSLLDENLPEPVEHKKNADKLPFPGNTTGHGDTQLPRYSQIEVLSPTGNESVGNPPAYPGNSAEFVQPPAPNNALQMILDDLPPPPPHLAALTGAGKDSPDGKEQQGQQQQQALWDSNHLSIQQELHTRTGSDLSDLPPAIASFMNRVRQNSGGSAQELKPPDQQPESSAFSPLPRANATVDQRHQPWQPQLQQQQYSQQRHQQISEQQQNWRGQQQQLHPHQQHNQLPQQHQHNQQLKVSLPNEPFVSEAQTPLRSMPPDGSSTRSSLQENIITSGGIEKELSTPPDLSDSSSHLSSEESEDRKETSSISYGSLPRPIRHHHPTNGPLQMTMPRSYMQQSSYPHSLPPTMSASYTGRMDHGFMHAGHHGPGSVISSTSSYQQQHANHSGHMYNQLADGSHMDRQLLERQRMDRLQAMERQKQIDQQLPLSRPRPIEFNRQIQFNHQPPLVPPGTQQPQAMFPRGSQDWSPNINAGRQRNLSYQDDDSLLKRRQLEAQHRLMQQENSRRAFMPQQGVYHAESLQHLHMLPNHSSANDGSWNGPRHHHPYNYHSIDHTHEQPHMGHIGPYLHQAGGRHSYSATPSARELLGPPPSMHPHHHQQFQQRHRGPQHPGFGQQPPPPNHEQSDKKNYSVIQV